MAEILYLSRNRLLRKKKKKISETHEKTITCSISVNNNKLATGDNFSSNPQVRELGSVQTEEDDEVETLDKMTGSMSQYSSARESLHSEYMAVPVRSLSPEIRDLETKSASSGVQKSRSYLGDLPQLVVSSTRCMVTSDSESVARVPVTFSWPSLEPQGQDISVHTPSIDSHTAMEAPVTGSGGIGGPNRANIHRISSACDSGYSELDIDSTGAQEQARAKEPAEDVTTETEEKLDISYMEELQLYFNLDKMFDKASHEENCFRELDLSICSDESKDGSCSEYSCALPSNTAKLFYHPQSSVDSFASANSNSLTTNNQAVISLAQLFPTNKNLHEHNVSKKYLESIQNKQHFNNKVKESAVLISSEQHTQAKFSRENSLRSLPITGQPEEDKSEDSDEDTLSDLRRLSLPKVTQLGKDAVVIAEQSQNCREIFI